MITVLSNVAARQDYGTDDRGGSPHFRDGTLAPCRYTHQDRDKDKGARTGDRLPNDSGRRDVTSQYPCSSTIWQRYQNKHDAPRGKPYEPNSDFNQELDHRCDDSRFTRQERWNEKVEQLAANNLTIPQDAIASLLQRLVLPAFPPASSLRIDT
jgi:hypothetical protein